MAKYEQKLKARVMRKEGISIITIAKKLGVTKGSVSLWCRDILLTPEQVEKLKGQKGSAMGRWLGAESNRKKKRDAIEQADDWGKAQIRNISKRELLLISTALYWCEGSKMDSSSSFMLVNSDPDMILIMKKFLLSVLKVKKEDLVCGIQINRMHENRIHRVLIFWKKLLELKGSQIRKPYFVNTKVHKVYENYDKYYGVCRLFVRKSKHLKYKILGLIRALKSEILSA
ncbi:MAG: hypothetical protein UT65_C0009G0010 [Parcubacteria group bacterium GW2011_GWF2_39_8b]|uniref:Uncharacterized protein n=3 Tax=Candidatus Zambryskiibacteriota TaxID=1817925 RepID=A0A1G2T7M9_9BACT|nr:MAG: hypothetical protein UT65_C0009G0010 [Parcubacteria group bacterium GW2011_GWF2_39_8b]KKR45507.1 MAG: hypothetical protein UT81_C0012G0010 [Parcubacteria group bacterium GW2011_GWA2_40_14]OHA92631.1 MAG: hypothetical protein A2W58_00550 [Candidatus Zambryskibacteria bacterium RIFCSPHIGHO2_02_38_10.5]OHA96171.1 MAG: hypothetical protein A3C63_02280 [Candidatus Zambryskibacteria bacterium RIFCSPHIGHO2_02_FULL_39_82]OHA97599.1 MAG: hypothetical protein A3E32_02960 [Candidatus Zambryskibact